MNYFCFGCMRPRKNSIICEHCGYDARSSNGPDQLQVGSMLWDKYLVGRIMENKGYCTRYMGLDVRSQQIVEIREYPDERDQMYDMQTARNLLPHEIQGMRHLQNTPGLAGGYEYVSDLSKIYLIENHLEGELLEVLIHRIKRPLTVYETLTMLRPVMEALEKLHRHSIIHRNVAPHVILVDSNQNTVLKRVFRFEEQVNCSEPQYIRGHFWRYMPVEMMSSKGKQGPWTDVYAIAAVIYFCLTGHPPANSAHRLIEGWEPDWHSIPGLNHQQRRALQRAMEVRPQNRQQSMRQLIDDLYGNPFVHVDSGEERYRPHLAGVPARPETGNSFFSNWFHKKK